MKSLKKENDQKCRYNKELSLAFDFVCKSLNIKQEDFISLAMANLLEEELDFIKHYKDQISFEELEKHQETVMSVKNRLSSRIL